MKRLILTLVLLAFPMLASAQPVIEIPLETLAQPPPPAAFTVRPPAAPVMAMAPDTALQANAQNPNTIEFSPSPDHSTIENGVALVTRYDLQVFSAASAVVVTIGLGKPTPISGVITNTTLLRPATIGLPAGTYTAKVLAVGPGGSTASAASNPFDLTPRSPGASGTPVIR